MKPVYREIVLDMTNHWYQGNEDADNCAKRIYGWVKKFYATEPYMARFEARAFNIYTRKELNLDIALMRLRDDLLAIAVDTPEEAKQQVAPAGDGREVLPEVLKDIEARAQTGLSKYGTLLKTDNGRNALLDMYQELIDAVMYVKQLLMEIEDDEEN
jgi:hypothetical protein